MTFENRYKKIAALLGEPVRAMMLWHLLDGRAYTAGELAICADTTPQSASNHLQKLLSAELLVVEKQGRHRYYRLASPEVAYVVESIANLIPPEEKKSRKEQLPVTGHKYARTCYDHLAGKAGVLLTEALVKKEILIPENEVFAVSEVGKQWFSGLDIDVEVLRRKKRSFARPCLDWSERKHHLAGALGAALLDSMAARQWLRKKQGSREVIITSEGQSKLYGLLNINL
ncbi:ArsR/SmtB family transcription factor [Sinomicrobium weinanense]|uniref:Helix-turn-helix transcriptional regulator n=1 Tax=Sinomicrobium weinanense TaxID=2842200 RepID=A0A926JN89_9FLAO|nr:metalloregulator ArsR/SmtB family transcription factor [Sinomicrobium weinanense]MBC9794415.1 helix-turn-helix transcriptional regulator [Sinomicrobium weinanense]MBU3124322.1 helix-turn-helix domain-containing protein [Sinomicrobium weinanense]